MAGTTKKTDDVEKSARVNRIKASYKIPSDWRELSETRFLYLKLTTYLQNLKVDIRNYRLIYEEVDADGYSKLKETYKGIQMSPEEAKVLCKELADMMLELDPDISSELTKIIEKHESGVAKTKSILSPSEPIVRSKEYVSVKRQKDVESSDEAENKSDTEEETTSAPPPMKRQKTGVHK